MNTTSRPAPSATSTFVVRGRNLTTHRVVTDRVQAATREEAVRMVLAKRGHYLADSVREAE